ncbi:MAG: homogentisate 1,2-dioxygenase [Phycisphaerae bacterium]|nr:homogentisate 1,2-dioxygenase [Phycisphaerae bacterium]
MIHRHTLGRIPAKHHIAMRDEDGKLLMEQMVTREGFHGPYSILYFRTPPTDEFSVEKLALPGFCPFELVKEQPLHRRHVRTQDFKPAGDFLTGRKTLMVNSDIHVGVCKPAQPADRFFSNGDGDECWFIKEGSGRLESVYGVLPFKKHDYILIPRSTPYRLHLDGDRGSLLVFEGKPRIGIPSDYRNAYGQLTDYAPFCHRDFRLPTELLRFDERTHGKPPYKMVVKQNDELTVHCYEKFPLDVVGWDGAVYPVAFNIHDYQPKTALVHLPPTIHTTFAGDGFVICSFVPRMVDYHPQAIPCPYGHASVDMDEILYYVEGNFTSRKGIESESISLHPQGVPHGPHPGTYEASIGTKTTSELAVMMDCYKPLRLTTVADGTEDKQYHTSWVRNEPNPFIS